jgi:hypothetical protein
VCQVQAVRVVVLLVALALRRLQQAAQLQLTRVQVAAVVTAAVQVVAELFI